MNLKTENGLIFLDYFYLNYIDNSWERSLSLFKEAENLYKIYNLKHKLINILGHQGVINRKIRSYDLALKYLQEAKVIAIQLNYEISLEWVNHHIAYVFLNQGQYDLAQELSQEGLEKSILAKRDNITGDFYEQIGLIRLGQNKVNEAVESFKLSLFFRKKIGNIHGTASSYKHLSLAYLINGKYIKSYQAIKECLIIFHNLKVLDFTRTYRIVCLFLEWAIGKKSWTS